LSPPCSSIVRRPRWIAPMDAAETLPYCVVNCLALNPFYAISAKDFGGA
jgi:hypothetical protein